MPRHLLNLNDLGSDGLAELLDRADELKRTRGRPDHPRPLAGKSIGLIMEKASTRTRISFELAEKRLSADSVNVSAEASSFKKGETLKDTARTLEALKPLGQHAAQRLQEPLLGELAHRHVDRDRGVLVALEAKRDAIEKRLFG